MAKKEKKPKADIKHTTPNPADKDRDKLGMPRIQDQQYKRVLPDGSIVDFSDLANTVLNLDKLVFITEDLLKEYGFEKEYIDEDPEQDYFWICDYDKSDFESTLFITNVASEAQNKYTIYLLQPLVILAKTPQELKVLFDLIKKYN